MPVIIGSNIQTVDTVDGFECNKCGKKYFADDYPKMEDMFHYEFGGGWGSVWGDGASFDIVLCGDCFYELMKDYVTEHINLPNATLSMR